MAHALGTEDLGSEGIRRHQRPDANHGTQYLVQLVLVVVRLWMHGRSTGCGKETRVLRVSQSSAFAALPPTVPANRARPSCPPVRPPWRPRECVC